MDSQDELSVIADYYHPIGDCIPLLGVNSGLALL